MPSDYSYELPSMSDSSWDNDQSWTQSNDYSLGDSGEGASLPSASEYRQEDNWSKGWFTDSTAGAKQGNAAPTSSMTDDVWKWITSNQGASTIGGAAQGIMQAWAASNAAEANSKEKNLDREAAMALAMLKENRIAAHNESINKPMNLGLVKYQR